MARRLAPIQAVRVNRGWRFRWMAALLAACLAVAVGPLADAQAPPAPGPRDMGSACPDGAVPPHGFVDIGGNVPNPFVLR